MKKKSKSSARWVADHEKDEFVKRAKLEGLRSRAAYKLLEIDARFSLLKPGAVVVDLGAAPGGWLQVASRKVGPEGLVIGLDLLPIEPLEGVRIIETDFTEGLALEELETALEGRSVDLVFSDMAPNLSGMKAIDQPRAVYLAELALDFARHVLRPRGGFLAKCFEGEGIAGLRENIRSDFKQLNNVKPKASRDKSREIYLLGRGFKGHSDAKSGQM